MRPEQQDAVTRLAEKLVKDDDTEIFYYLDKLAKQTLERGFLLGALSGAFVLWLWGWLRIGG